MTTKLILVIVFIVCLVLMAYMKTNKKKKVVFLGDSITQLGLQANGYITQIQALIKQEDVEQKYQLLSAGVNGSTTLNLKERLQKNELQYSPDIAVVLIGLNDVWMQQETNSTIEQFEQDYTAIIQQLLQSNSAIVLCTLTVIGESTESPLNTTLNQYCDVIIRLAGLYNLPFIHLRQVFNNYLALNNAENMYSGILTTDGVHLNSVGNALVANEIWQKIKQFK
jgi:lysophospholipase L1-like esterase